jgi:dissimilatory sulfite reductase related protein
LGKNYKKEKIMGTKEITGKTIDVTDEGYLNNFDQWDEEVAKAIAIEEGVGELNEKHWEVIKYLQAFYKENGVMPSIRKLKKAGVVDTKELYSLFPGGPLKKSSKIAGLKKPESCV